MTFEERARDMLALERLRSAAQRRRRSPRLQTDAAEYDWDRPRRFTAAGHGRLKAFAEAAAERIAAELSALFCSRVALEPKRPAERYGAGILLDAEDWYELALTAGGKPCGAIRLPAALAAAWVERLLGGSPEAESRKLSDMEAALLLDVMAAVSRGLAAASRQCGGPAFAHAGEVRALEGAGSGPDNQEVCEFVFSPTVARDEDDATDEAAAETDAPGEDVPADAGEEETGAAADEAAGAQDGADPGEEGSDADAAAVPDADAEAQADAAPNDQAPAEMVVIVRSEVLGPVAEPDAMKKAAPSAEETRASLLGHLGRASVTMTAELGTAAVTVRDLMSLEPGDVVVLRKRVDDPVTVMVSGQTILQGLPATCAGQYAVQVLDLRRHPRLRL